MQGGVCATRIKTVNLTFRYEMSFCRPSLENSINDLEGRFFKLFFYKEETKFYSLEKMKKFPITLKAVVSVYLRLKGKCCCLVSSVLSFGLPCAVSSTFRVTCSFNIINIQQIYSHTPPCAGC